MKKTIKEELSEQYLRAYLANDNALIIYTENDIDDNLVDVKVRYIKRKTIIEDYLTSITMDDFKHRRSNFIRTNEDKTAIAIFKKEEDSYQLEKI